MSINVTMDMWEERWEYLWQLNYENLELKIIVSLNFDYF